MDVLALPGLWGKFTDSYLLRKGYNLGLEINCSFTVMKHKAIWKNQTAYRCQDMLRWVTQPRKASLTEKVTRQIPHHRVPVVAGNHYARK